jgi:hypothetical protein
MRIFVDAVRSCFKPADCRVLRNCLRFMPGRRAVRLALAHLEKPKKAGKQNVCQNVKKAISESF